MSIEIDLRSDTVTQPCPEMRAAIAQAEVGDDVIGNDPTVERLQARVAELLGKEDALFMPSGSMTNQIAIRLHCQPGDEFLCEADCHVYNYEQAAFAQLSGVVPRVLQGRQGILDPEQFVGMVRPEDDHLVRTRLVTLENTHNRGSGRVQPIETVEAICDWAHSQGLSTHLDGARLFNAVAASGVDAHRQCAGFDSVSICFSKGLGAPVGSALAGTSSFIRRARRARKLFGGAMRQVGILAAGALYALEHNRERLVEDHAHARMLASAVDRSPGLSLTCDPQTNILIFDVDSQLGTARRLVDRLSTVGVGCLAVAPHQVRMVTHKDVDSGQIERACQLLEEAATHLLAAVGQTH